jgi:Amt family ammonium transporter
MMNRLKYIQLALIVVLLALLVSPAEEIQGLDIGEHGVSAYPNFVSTEPAVDGEKA